MADRRTRKRKPYTIKQVELIGSHALQSCERILLSKSSTTDEIIKASNSISGLMNTFRRLKETGEIVERIETLEQKT